MLFTTWLYSLLKVCVSRRRHCRVREQRGSREQKQWRHLNLHCTGLLEIFFSPLWPAPSPGPPGSRCLRSRSHCFRWGWWRSRRWCWRSARRWTWRWTKSLSSCWETETRSETWWEGWFPLEGPPQVFLEAGEGDESSPPWFKKKTSEVLTFLDWKTGKKKNVFFSSKCECPKWFF